MYAFAPIAILEDASGKRVMGIAQDAAVVDFGVLWAGELSGANI
jgi:hypothetical protein